MGSTRSRTAAPRPWSRRTPTECSRRGWISPSHWRRRPRWHPPVGRVRSGPAVACSSLCRAAPKSRRALSRTFGLLARRPRQVGAPLLQELLSEFLLELPAFLPGCDERRELLPERPESGRHRTVHLCLFRELFGVNF